MIFALWLRVAVKTILLRNSSQGGGSTITQQLAKTLFPRETVSSRIFLELNIFKLFESKFKECITSVNL